MTAAPPSRRWALVRAWAPAVAWMAVMFTASTDLGSSDNTSRIIVPLLRLVAPGLAPESIALIHAVIRKTAHLTEYAILGALLFRGFLATAGDRRPAPRWRAAFLAWLLAAAFAVSDELHQVFVESRGPAVTDVLIDTSGAALGLALVAGVTRLRRRRAPSHA